MEAHELLNAAARAGRAGHLANGAVLLVPDPVCSFSSTRRLDAKVKRKLSSILPEDDRCIDITDPLEAILDRFTQGDVVNREVRYTVNRLAALADAEGSDSSDAMLINRSLGAFIAKKRGEERAYTEKIDSLWAEVQEAAETASQFRKSPAGSTFPATQFAATSNPTSAFLSSGKTLSKLARWFRSQALLLTRRRGDQISEAKKAPETEIPGLERTGIGVV